VAGAGQPATGAGAGSDVGSAMRCWAGSRVSTTTAPTAETAAHTHEPAATPSRKDCWTAVTASPGSEPATASPDGLVAAVLARGFGGLAVATTADSDPDPTARLLACGRGYRRFALSHPRHYAAMFGAGVALDAPTEELAERADAAFTALVDRVRYGMDGGVLRAGDVRETAQLIWSAVHGAVSLEISGVQQTADPAASYEALLQMLLAGLR
jgi:hypothetical protein